MKIKKLIDDMSRRPYRLKIKAIRTKPGKFLIGIVNFAHLQISAKRAVSFSIKLWCRQAPGEAFAFSDQGDLLRLTTKAVKIVYNLQMRATRIRKINVIPIFSGGLVRYMNDANSMFHYLKPTNQRGSIWISFRTAGYQNLKRAIAEYAVMALSLIQYVEINLRQLRSGDHHSN